MLHRNFYRKFLKNVYLFAWQIAIKNVKINFYNIVLNECVLSDKF
nr:MAG TPA: hypothetical protein [Caudoviricetes sp.]